MKQKLKIVALILAVAACAIAAIGGTVLVGRLAERLFDAWTAPPPKPHTFAATPIQGPPNPVYLADGVTSSANLLGIAGNPMVTTAVIQNDASAPIPVDPVPGLELDTLVVQPSPALAQVLIDAGTRCVTDINWTNEGTITGYAQVYCGQYVLDAGGTAAAATAPSLQLRCPAGTVCGIKLEAPLCCAGATWYSGVDAGFLLQTGAPALTLTAASLR